MTFALMPDKKPTLKNRRDSPRWSLKGSCSYRVDDDTTVHTGYAKDVSCVGACMSTDRHLPVNQKVRLTIPLPEGGVIKVSGTVAWTRPVNYRNEVGIRFFNAGSEAQDAIVRYILNADKKRLINHWFKGWNGT